jgi:hypothetical protein
LPILRFADSLGFGQAADGDARRPREQGQAFLYRLGEALEKRVRADRPLRVIRDRR